MAHTAPQPNRFEQRRRRNREALLAAAIELFQRRGIRATRLEEICERADVSARTFFNHFETREHLYRAIANQRIEQMAMRLDASDPQPFGARLVELLEQMGTYLAERPAYRELVGEMLSLRPEPGGEAGRHSRFAMAVRRFVEHGVERGEVARSHPPEILADVLLGALTTTLANWCADDDYDLEGEIGRIARVLVDLLTPGETS